MKKYYLIIFCMALLNCTAKNQTNTYSPQVQQKEALILLEQSSLENTNATQNKEPTPLLEIDEQEIIIFEN